MQDISVQFQIRPLMQVKESPSKIFFFCSEPSPEGGETSMVLSNMVVNEMEEKYPEIMAKISVLGMIFSNKTARDDGSGSGFDSDKPWRSYWSTSDEEEAQKRFENCKSTHTYTYTHIHMYTHTYINESNKLLLSLKYS